MYLEIVTPEAILFSSEVTSVAVPGTNGEFQMLQAHASVVSNLTEGIIKIDANNPKIEQKFESKFFKTEDGRLGFKVNSGTLEMKDNKAIILAD